MGQQVDYPQGSDQSAAGEDELGQVGGAAVAPVAKRQVVQQGVAGVPAARQVQLLKLPQAPIVLKRKKGRLSG